MLTQPGSDVIWRSGPALAADRPRTLAELCVRSARHRHPVFHDQGEAWTWSDLLRQGACLAGAWQYRVGPGDRVAIVLANGRAHLLAELAAWHLGAIAVPMAPGFLPTVRRDLLSQVQPALVADDADQVLAEAAGGSACAGRAVAADDPCIILFTSGSSGRARGVVLSHDNVCSQQAAYDLLWPSFGDQDRVAGYLPWHHSFGALAERLWVMQRGAAYHVIPGHGRDHDALLRTLTQVQPTVWCSVPKLHAVVTAAGLPCQGLRWAFTAGAPLAPAVAKAYTDRDIPVYEGWGLTETGPSATITAPGRPWIPGIVGDPIPGVAVGIDRDGRILVSGPGVMLGYWRDADPERSLMRHGSQRCIDSGDIGEWTNVGLRLRGRADHLAKLANGEKVSLADWELRLADIPGVAHAVVGVDDDLVAILEAGPELGDAELIRQVVAANAKHTVPWQRIRRLVRTQTSLCYERGDLTASHKIVRTAVLSRYRAWQSCREQPQAAGCGIGEAGDPAAGRTSRWDSGDFRLLAEF